MGSNKPFIPPQAAELVRATGVAGDWSEPTLPPTVCGIYLLIKRNEIVYVGQSVDVLARLRSHVLGKRCPIRAKDFDRFLFFACAKKELDPLEGMLIQQLNPKYNREQMRRTGPRRPKRDKGVLCPNEKCRSSKTFALYTRHRTATTTRVRRCAKCGRRFMTAEKIESNAC